MPSEPIAQVPFFSRVSRRTVQTSAGPCEMPILYSDASLLTLLYRVDAAKARALVDPAFEPWLVLGKATAVVCAFEYRTTTIDPYGELGIGILIKRAGTRPSLLRAAVDLRKEKDAGLYVVNLPVTTESARSAGRELWGFPKYVTPMETTFREDSVRIGLGRELEITMGKSGGLRMAGMPFVLYSVHSGRVLRTIVEVDYRARWGGASSAAVKVTGAGPTAGTARALGLDGVRPMAAFRADTMRSILPLGEEMGSAPS
jgi:hypothetical protein